MRPFDRMEESAERFRKTWEAPDALFLGHTKEQWADMGHSNPEGIFQQTSHMFRRAARLGGPKWVGHDYVKEAINLEMKLELEAIHAK